MIPNFLKRNQKIAPQPSMFLGVLPLMFGLFLTFPLSLNPSDPLPGLLADGATVQAKPQSIGEPDVVTTRRSEDRLAALTIYMEARGESFAGKLAVAAVIRNRMQLKYHSDGTIKGTVLRRSQFQPWNTQRPHHIAVTVADKRMRDSLLAWRLVQDGRNIVNGAVLFFNPRMVETPKWAMVGHKVATIGRHEFYRPRKLQT